MGYSLSIGEAVIDWSSDMVRIGVDRQRHDDAPAFGEPTDHTNSRWPSYSSWANFCEAVGITKPMLNSRNGGVDEFQVGDEWVYCLMPTHPGCAPITSTHLKLIEDAVAAYKKRHPDHIAKYPPPKPGAKPILGHDLYRDEDLVQDERYDGNLCRAEWLLYWMRWAVENCEKPVFVNT